MAVAVAYSGMKLAPAERPTNHRSHGPDLVVVTRVPIAYTRNITPAVTGGQAAHHERRDDSRRDRGKLGAQILEASAARASAWCAMCFSLWARAATRHCREAWPASEWAGTISEKIRQNAGRCKPLLLMERRRTLKSSCRLPSVERRTTSIRYNAYQA